MRNYTIILIFKTGIQRLCNLQAYSYDHAVEKCLVGVHKDLLETIVNVSESLYTDTTHEVI